MVEREVAEMTVALKGAMSGVGGAPGASSLPMNVLGGRPAP